MPNPFLPLNEYIPDVEPHVFGDRIFLYGSHDRANSDRFCVEDYAVYSADVKNLDDWNCKGISYRKEQDPRSLHDKTVDYYAPDCVKGNDGRYYLYYFAAGPNTEAFGPMSVAVSDYPDGPFEYLHDICYKDGKPVLKYLTNDPAVLNDDGKIYLYYGWGLGRDFSNRILQPLYRFVLNMLTKRSFKEIRETEPSILSCAVVQLEDDMFTVKSEPKAVLDSKTTADKKSSLYNHPFYEAPSIRKINGLYYLIYSSNENNELAYATSRYPDRDFEYRGVIISNSDLGYLGNKKPKNNSGTIHGSIECINGQWYVFYHRSTNNTDFSRQACVEPIEIKEDGSIDQVEMTSLGFEKILKPEGTCSAAICCNLITEKPIRLGVGKQQSMPRISEKKGILCLSDMIENTEAVYKYFDLSKPVYLKLEYVGDAEFEVNGNKADDNGLFHIEGAQRQSLSVKVIRGKADVFSLIFKEI